MFGYIRLLALPNLFLRPSATAFSQSSTGGNRFDSVYPNCFVDDFHGFYYSNTEQNSCHCVLQKTLQFYLLNEAANLVH